MRSSTTARLWQRSIEAYAERAWPFRRPRVIAVMGAAWTITIALMAMVGYPGWRVAVLCALALLSAAPFLFPPGRHRWFRWGERITLLVVFLGAAVSGGIHSPVLLATLVPGFQSVILRGVGRASVLRFSITAALVAGMALLPEAWVGPELPRRALAPILLAILCLSLTLTLDSFRVFTRTFSANLEELVRARDAVAEQAFARARQMELLSAKLSHELKNPLGAVKALVQLSARSAGDAETRERLAVVEGEVERIRSILEGYLLFSRPLESLRPSRVALGVLVDDVLAILEGRATASRVALDRRGDATIVADARQLKEALLNLVANALEATPAAGQVSVEVQEQGETVRLAVRDTGRGMSPEVLERIGAPFFTTRADGTGLGVLLARNVMTQHGGRLEYTSEPGRGTVATCTLPRTPGEAACHGPCAGGG